MPDSLTGHAITCIRGERTVFTGVDFSVEEGGALLLLGPNGCGKSSLLRLVAGLSPPAEGRIAWNGVSIDDDPALHHRRVRYLAHLDALKPALSVADNLRFWAGFYGGDEARVPAVLDRLGIGHLADAPAQLLSAGQRRRTALARVIVTPSPLWLLDEPTVTLDEDSIRVLEGLIAEHRAGGGLVVTSTHAGFAVPDAKVLAMGRREAA